MAYPPHGVCWLWDPWLVALHAASDFAIFLAYWLIPWLIVRIARASEAGDAPIAFPRLRQWWTAFILACGLTHLSEVVVVWFGGGWLWASAIVKVVAAAVSLGAFIATWRRRHRIMALIYFLVDAERRQGGAA
jgi:hypothetical protein